MKTEKIKLLIADDHTLFVEGLTSLLLKNKIFTIVKCFTNGKHLTDYLQVHTDSADVLILDINMPETNGMDCLKFIKQQKLSLKTLVLSMYEDPFLVKKIMEEGAHAFLIKNTGNDELLKAINEIRDGRTYLSHKMKKLIESENENNLFSAREMDVLRCVVQGLSSKAIALKLSISFNTVETHRKNLLRKANVKTTIGLIKFALENKLIE